MKVKETEKVIQIKTYVADDGMEFINKIDCIIHEQDIKGMAAEETAKGLPRFYLGPETESSDYDWEWWYVTSQEELDAARIFRFDRDAAAYTYEPPEFPCWLAFVEDSDNKLGWIAGTPEQVIEQMRGFERDLHEMIEENTP